eukprot:jgi/Phyca11/117519/e_gw1.33.367.1
MVVAPGMPSLFWSSWSTRSAQHTALYIAGEIEKVIADVEHETTAQVVAVVTDNANNMRSATGRIHTRRTNIVSGGCAAHSRAVAVTRFVKDHLALLDEFKRLQQEMRDVGLSARNLVLPVPTRWYSVFACLQIRDINFWNGLRTTVRLLDPIIKDLRELEADNVFVSGVYKWFRWLRYHSAYGITTPEQEIDSAERERAGEDGMELLSNTVNHITSAASIEN